MREIEKKASPGVKKADVSLKDNQLTINVQTEAQKLYLKWREKFIQENEKQSKTIPVPYPVTKTVPVPAELTKFQKLYLGLGKVVFWLLCGFILYKIPWKSLLRL